MRYPLQPEPPARVQRWRVWFSPYLLAVALVPAFVQIDYSACAYYGNSRLSELELIVDGENRLVGFDPDLRSYDASLTLTTEARVHAVTEDPEASVSIFVLPEGESLTVSGERETYLDVDADLVAGQGFPVPLPPGSAVLQVWVTPHGGATDYYEVNLDIAGFLFPCTEQGIRDAIAEGGGPHYFDCAGPTVVATEDTIVIDNDVILDGRGNLIVEGRHGPTEYHRVFSVPSMSTVELLEMTVTGGGIKRLSPPGGSGIENHGTLAISGVSVSKNMSGGIENYGTLLVSNSTLDQNEGAYTGGAIDNYGALTVMDSLIADNEAEGYSGGIGSGGYGTSTTLIRTTIVGNRALRHTSGGLGIGTGGEVMIVDSTVSGNRAPDAGGLGAGNNSILTVMNSTISGNIADSRAGGVGVSYGATVAIVNSTVSENSAYEAGGIGVLESGSLILLSSTVANNQATDGSSAIKTAGGGVQAHLSLRGAMVQGSCIYDTPTLIDLLGYNIESPGDTCGFDANKGDQVKVSADDLKLGELSDNGGPTMTHALGAGSVAIDQIPQADCVDADGEPLTTDQRGEPRPGGTMCDVGAFELQP